MFFIFFFFSSRRRHTRCYRDWSSDVCSSDLGARRRWPGQARPRLKEKWCNMNGAPSATLIAGSFGNNAHLAEFKRRIGLRSGALRADTVGDQLDGDLLAGIFLCGCGDVEGESFRWPYDSAAG